MNVVRALVRMTMVPAASVVIVIGGAMSLSAAAHAGNTAVAATAGHCVASGATR